MASNCHLSVARGPVPNGWFVTDTHSHSSMKCHMAAVNTDIQDCNTASWEESDGTCGYSVMCVKESASRYTVTDWLSEISLSVLDEGRGLDKNASKLE